MPASVGLEKDLFVAMFIAGRVASESNTKFIEYFSIFFRHHYSGVSLTTIEQWQSRKSTTTILIVERKHRERNQYFIGMQTRIAAVQTFNFSLLNRFNNILREEFYAVFNSSQIFGSVN